MENKNAFNIFVIFTTFQLPFVPPVAAPVLGHPLTLLRSALSGEGRRRAPSGVGWSVDTRCGH